MTECVYVCVRVSVQIRVVLDLHVSARVRDYGCSCVCRVECIPVPLPIAMAGGSCTISHVIKSFAYPAVINSCSSMSTAWQAKHPHDKRKRQNEFSYLHG